MTRECVSDKDALGASTWEPLGYGTRSVVNMEYVKDWWLKLAAGSSRRVNTFKIHAHIILETDKHASLRSFAVRLSHLKSLEEYTE